MTNDKNESSQVDPYANMPDASDPYASMSEPTRPASVRADSVRPTTKPVVGLAPGQSLPGVPNAAGFGKNGPPVPNAPGFNPKLGPLNVLRHPSLMPQEYGDEVTGVEQFGRGIKNTVKDLWGGAKDAGKIIKKDPTSIVPMWFDALMGVISTPAHIAASGDPISGLSAAAGGDPERAKKYADDGDSGGAMWELVGKPIALLVVGEAVGRSVGMTGSPFASRAENSRLAIIRDIYSRGVSEKAPIDLADVKLAHEALQDAAQDLHGEGIPGKKSLEKSAPKRSFFDPLVKPEQGNKNLLNLSRRAVDLAGEPADQVNAIYGYIKGKQQAQNIQRNLYKMAADAEANGHTALSSQLKARAKSLDGKNTLGQIYDLKKEANKVAKITSTDEASFGLIDSWAELASAIREEIYPIYDAEVSKRGVNFSLSQAGRKEGAAIKFRNGLEKSYREAQDRVGEIYRSGKPTGQVSRGMSPRHAVTGWMGRTIEKSGAWANPQGALNQDVVRGIGEVTPGQTRESLQMTKPAQFGPAPPPTTKALPGKTYTFKIRGTGPIESKTGELAQSAAHAPRHSFESPAYTTSSAPMRTAKVVNGRVVAGPEGSMGADVRTAGKPEPRADFVHGAGDTETRDPIVAQETLDKMKMSLRRNPDQPKLAKGISELEAQLEEYWDAQGRAKISHTHPTSQYTPRKAGTPRKKIMPPALRRTLPAAVSGYVREYENE